MYNTRPSKLANLPRWTPIAIILFGIFIITILVVSIIAVTSDSSNEPSDITDLSETLSEPILATITDDPNKDYQTNLESTKFADLTAQEFCTTMNFNCLAVNGESLVDISALNSNILNYYLDNNYAVVIVSSRTTTVVYGAIYSIPNYVIFTTSQQDFDEYRYASRAELFNNLDGTELFYILNTN